MDQNTGMSSFEGNVGSWVGTAIIASLLTTVTLGIALPWAMCMYLRFYFDNSVIQGRRIKFTGSGGALFGNYIKWFLLCIVTLGIYGFWVVPKMCEWVNKNLSFQN
jgi:uncharacterized membrane protein YjgN (DUF898 family)